LISEFTEPIQMAKVINIVNSQPVNLEKNETM
jgi:predicted transcriptional regulator